MSTGKDCQDLKAFHRASMIIHSLVSKPATPEQLKFRTWLGIAAIICIVEGLCVLTMRLFEIPPQDGMSLIFHASLLSFASLSALRIVNPVAGTGSKVVLVIGVILCKGAMTALSVFIDRSHDSLFGDLAATFGITMFVMAMVLPAWKKPSELGLRSGILQVIGLRAHRQVRITMYLLLFTVGGSVFIQTWKAQKAGERRAQDANILTQASAQAGLSERISRIAGMAQNRDSQGELFETLTSLESKTNRLRFLLSTELTAERGESVEDLSSLEQAVADWHRQTRKLVSLTVELHKLMMAGSTTDLQATISSLQTQAEASRVASQLLGDKLEHAVHNRNYQDLRATIGWSLFNFILLLILVLGVVEPVVRLVQRQYQRLITQREELERLALVAENTTNAVLITDGVGRISWINRGFSKITGYSPDDVLGKPLPTVLRHDRVDPSQMDTIKKAIICGSGVRSQVLITVHGDRDCWLDIDIQAVTDKANQTSHFVFVCNDITEQVNQRTRLASILAALPTGVIVYSAEGQVIDCNPMSGKITGMAKQQLLELSVLSSNWLRLFSDDGSELPLSERPELRTLRTGLPVIGFTCRLLLPNGNSRWVTINTDVMRGVLGDVSGVVSCLVDVTESRAQQEILAMAIEGEGVGIWQADPTTGQMTCNDTFFEVLGCGRDEFACTLEAWSQRIHPEDQGLWQETLQSHLAQPNDRFRCELRLQHQDGNWIFLMVSGTSLERKDDGSSSRIAGVNIDITEKKGLRSQLINSERIDNLTQLPNRTVALELVHQSLARAKADPEYHFAVLHIDADRFKQVNDSLGHEVGDSLLRLIGNRLRSTLRPSDAVSRSAGDGQTTARIGGDEFLIVLEDMRSSDDAGKVAQRLLDALSKPYVIDGHTIHSSASMGIVTRANASDSAEAILRDADIAMYEAKRNGRGRFVVFEAGMHDKVTARAGVESDLRSALLKKELFVVYQPVLDMATGRATGVEALVRWKHPTRGFIPPIEFIPIAEETGLICALGDFVLETACKQFMEWQRKVPDCAPSTLAVNLSRAQLALPSLVESVRMTLDVSGMEPGQLQLEITESLAAQDETIQSRLRELKEIGITLALDDFGTGYSSLACLHLLPVDTVKIDRSFVSPAENSNHHRVLIEATIRVAQSLGMATVAEGIEVQGQADLLQALHCDKGQGYLFSKPLTADDLVRWLESRPPARQAADKAPIISTNI